jgi:hypothetical protein
MKLGCIIRFLFIGFLLIGSAYYIYEKYGGDIIDFSREGFVLGEAENILDSFDAESYKDSVKAFIIRNSIDPDKLESSIDNINQELQSIEIDSLKLQKLKEMLLKNER